MLHSWIFILVFSFFSCEKNRPIKSKPQPKPKIEQAIERLFDKNILNDQIVSIAKDGSAHGFGDSLLWNGIAIGVLPCDLARPMIEKLREMQEAHYGYLVRYHPLPKKFKETTNQVSFDGLTGVLYGLNRYYDKCDPVLPAKIISDLYVNLKSADWIVYPGHSRPNVDSKIYGPIRYTIKLTAHRLAGFERPSFAEKVLFENAMVAWVYGTMVTKGYCFRAHLANLHLLLIEESKKTRSLFCQHTKQMDLPLTDWYCGREKYKKWYQNYLYDVHEYRHQRCHYEGQDGNGYIRPTLDYIFLDTLIREHGNDN
jgi:hypothetical protein